MIGMSHAEIIDDFPELEEVDILIRRTTLPARSALAHPYIREGANWKCRVTMFAFIVENHYI